jgi:UDP-N-acetylmuramoylalanine--D-glutamate ligase
LDSGRAVRFDGLTHIEITVNKQLPEQIKRVVVIGLGTSGEAAARLLAEQQKEVVVRDESGSVMLEQRAEGLRALGVSVELASGLRLEDTRFDLGILSPGIDPARPLVHSLSQARVPLWSELELAYRFCECPLVAITGTNGKTTTTELCYAVLSAAGKRTSAAGNIGVALSDAVRRSAELDVMVVEASSFQLEAVVDFHPRIAALLNLTPDHMDRYRFADDYLSAKLRVFENQDENDFAILHASFGDMSLKAHRVTFSARGHAADYTLKKGVIHHRGRPVLDMARTKLHGLHNAENAMVAMAVGHIYGIDEKVICGALAEYRPAPHRCEMVAEINGVRYINDSKATNTDAVAMALRSQAGPVVLIAGGKDKGFAFDDLADLVAERCRAVFLIGETAPAIEKAWGRERCRRMPDLASAVREAAKVAEAGDVVLLSPACSSFDMFKSYADRGEQFRKAVQSLADKK